MENLRPYTDDHPQPPDTIRFVLLSDTHNVTDNLRVPDGDVLLHSGDFSDCGKPENIVHFNEFLGRLPHPHKVVIAGNHDLSFDIENWEGIQKNFGFPPDTDPNAIKASLTNCTYLEESG